MKVELKKVNISRSIFNQMLSIGSLPKNDDYEVLGFVITPKKPSLVIVKIGELYRTANHIKEVEGIAETLQMDDGNMGYIFQPRTKVKVKLFNDFVMVVSHVPDEARNLEILRIAKTFVERIIAAGQIYI